MQTHFFKEKQPSENSAGTLCPPAPIGLSIYSTLFIPWLHVFNLYWITKLPYLFLIQSQLEQKRLTKNLKMCTKIFQNDSLKQAKDRKLFSFLKKDDNMGTAGLINGVMGFTKHSPFLDYLIKCLRENFPTQNSTLYKTGSGLLRLYLIHKLIGLTKTDELPLFNQRLTLP